MENKDGFLRDSHWIIVKHDFSQKASVALPQGFLSKYDALMALEKYVEDYLREKDGKDGCNTKIYNECKIIYVCKNNLCDPGFSIVNKNSAGEVTSWYAKPMTMEKTIVDSRWPTRNSTKWLPYGHYATRSAQDHTAKYTIYRKEQISKSGILFSGEDKCIPVFSVELVEIPNCTYNNLITEDHDVYDTSCVIDDGSTFRKILTAGLQVTPVFTALRQLYTKEAKSVDEQLNCLDGKPIKPTKEVLTKLGKNFHKQNVDAGELINIHKLRDEHPNDFVVWRCTGKKEGMWVPYVRKPDTIIADHIPTQTN